MNKTLYADFNNADEEGRIRLNTNGTIADLKKHSTSLRTGLRLNVSDGEIKGKGTVEFSDNKQIWVIRLDD